MYIRNCNPMKSRWDESYGAIRMPKCVWVRVCVYVCEKVCVCTFGWVFVLVCISNEIFRVHPIFRDFYLIL